MRSLDPLEKRLFLDGIFEKYGYDFRQYAEASFDRRLLGLMDKYRVDSLFDLLKNVLRQPDFFRGLLPQLTIGTSEFFRDPNFYRCLRQEVFPHLRTYPNFKIWSAGCSTGEEVISLAIALHEEDLLDRATIYATDINPVALKRAKDGIYDIHGIETFTKNYVQAGGKSVPSEYYTADYGLVRFNPMLTKNVVFTEHNLATDAVFTEANLVLCRNVLIYFDKELQERALSLFQQSLSYRGFLGIGSRESLRFSNVENYYDVISAEQRVFRQKGTIPHL